MSKHKQKKKNKNMFLKKIIQSLSLCVQDKKRNNFSVERWV